jgi:hypothetical protein
MSSTTFLSCTLSNIAEPKCPAPSAYLLLWQRQLWLARSQWGMKMAKRAVGSYSGPPGITPRLFVAAY